MTNLYEEIIATCPPELITAREHGQIAQILSVGRTRLVPREIGNGLVIATIGLTAGNALLDVIASHPDFRYIKPLMDQGRLDVSMPLVRATIDGLVPDVLTAEQADALKALAEVPDSVSTQAVIEAMKDM